MNAGHGHAHAFGHFNALAREGLVLHSRRNFLKASLAGMAGLSLPGVLRAQDQALRSGRPPSSPSTCRPTAPSWAPGDRLN